MDDGKPFVPLGINYYRPGTGWAPQLWKKFDADATRQDFARMRELGVNCVRVFLTYGSFFMDRDQLHPEGLAKFDQMVELGLLPSLDAAKAEYDLQVRNGLMTQLVRIQPGKTVEQAHMRGRAMVAHWVYEMGKADNVIERKTRDGKTFFVVNDYAKLRELYGRLLAEVQRITSEGDYEAAKALIETYGVQVDQDLHKEVLERYGRLDLAPYSGFVNPVYTPVVVDGRIADVKIDLAEGYVEQMLRYGRDYSFLR